MNKIIEKVAQTKQEHQTNHNKVKRKWSINGNERLLASYDNRNDKSYLSLNLFASANGSQSLHWTPIFKVRSCRPTIFHECNIPPSHFFVSAIC